MEKDDGGPAFASVTDIREEIDYSGIGPQSTKLYFDGEIPKRKVIETSGGLTIRDYFAASALQGVLSEGLGKELSKTSEPGIKIIKEICTISYDFADAMLAARKA